MSPAKQLQRGKGTTSRRQCDIALWVNLDLIDEQTLAIRAPLWRRRQRARRHKTYAEKSGSFLASLVNGEAPAFRDQASAEARASLAARGVRSARPLDLRYPEPCLLQA